MNAVRRPVAIGVVGFVLAAAVGLAAVFADRRPAPVWPDQFTHDAAPAVFVTARLPIELTLRPAGRPAAIRLPVWIGPGRRPVDVGVAALDAAGREVATTTRIERTGLARVALPEETAPGAPLRVRITTDATRRDAAPRVLWSRDPPRPPVDVRYAGRPLAAVDVLPDTGPLFLLEYPWPTRWLLLLFLVPVALGLALGLAPALAAGGRGRAGSILVVATLVLAVLVASALLWQRDYTRRAAHLDADGYAASAEALARWVAEPAARPGVAAWFRAHPHSPTALVPALLAPLAWLGVPVAYAYALLSALAAALALWIVWRAAVECLGVSPPLALATTAAFACHPLMIRTFARPVTDAVGLLLVVATLWLLLRRMRAPGPRDALWLALLVFAHPLARPQGFGYWPFVAIAMVAADRVREGAWPSLPVLLSRGLRVFLLPALALAALYVHFDWFHNLELTFAKARRFRIDATVGDFLASAVGVVLALPAIAALRRGVAGPPLRADPRALSLLAWILYAAGLLVAVRAPFWLRHFLPVLPAVYWLAAMAIEPLRGPRRAAGLALLGLGAVLGVGVTVWQVTHLEALPGWLAAFLAVP